MANILYLGNSHPSTTSCHRANALRRLGHTVKIYDVDEMACRLAFSKFLEPIHFRTGYRFLQTKVVKWARRVVAENPETDLIWVNSGDKFGPECMAEFKKRGVPIILYNNDDPTGGRDGGRFNSLLASLPFYDLCVVMREVNVEEFKEKGAKKVLRVMMSYDEIIHKPFIDPADIPQAFRSEVVFIGTWMRHEKRDEFILKLINSGLPLAIYGERWEKSPYFKDLKHYYRGKGLSGRDYVAAIQGAKICLGLLSKGNRDLHTQRSMEVPYAGGLLCAERTSEHTELYKEYAEAIFWSDANECILVCKQLLANHKMRNTITAAGKQRANQNKNGNEDVCYQILKEVNLMERTDVQLQYIK
ncbi:glycosyltransferase [Mucilaginibacter achroorhodeus]|uniref:Glycosyltransferase n=1 Tax=Mucilaginibacter achroorhodeus TaxID=2599294 RepID=A0A563U6M0_9SPHI|nr:glycosyltransferase [Mucilaginibacter achroorhodeus]TWR26997.1 glycosyltransferase [Mucilaginibacter achroorhodeus]